ncbi:undecaprenyl-diphosphate phosphatase [Aestuariispira insulae]|uniref:Undecaprenyl-diphosphatase n=1 Tax=Aestuariispira insulae TaxID=1461337 RepID=A0A3D9H9M3_9PROT|nr:undecaprenyl-diphosphate phosphatase [Aestuariispira insulae]RED46194.1 undecaprenyl-diphosphatase [Aestuariispira insulae]
MALHHILILAIIQGITEFLPISSSGHLVLTGKVLGWTDQGLAIDVAVHVGTLLSVMLYFWRDVGALANGALKLTTGRKGPERKLFLNVVIGTIPIVIVGFLLKDEISHYLRNVELIAWTTIGFGILLLLADKLGMTAWRLEHISWRVSLAIGLAQVLALLPGTSRSGITMTAGRMLGIERSESARFSLLLSIPTIAAAGLLVGIEIHQAGNVALEKDALIAAAIAFVAGYISIWAMMAWLKRASFTVFVLYRLLLGGILLGWIYL